MFTLKCEVRGMSTYTTHFPTYEAMLDAISLRQALKIQGVYTCLETCETWSTGDREEAAI